MIEPKRMTIAEFDAFRQTADEGFTYELHDGVLYSFATGTVEHARLCQRLGSYFDAHILAPCEVFQGSISVRRHPERASSVVPDVLVTCEAPPNGQIYVTAPKLVVEVMSPSSQPNDLVRKLRVYEAVESIAEYLVVDSRAMSVRLFRRDYDYKLTLICNPYTASNDLIVLTTVAIDGVLAPFTLEKLYRGIL